MVASVAPEVFTDWKRPSAELHIARLFQVKSEDTDRTNFFVCFKFNSGGH